MPPHAAYRIRPARLEEAELLSRLEWIAGQRFAAIGMPDVAAYDPTPAAMLRDMIALGEVLVAVDGADGPVAAVQFQPQDSDMYVAQLDVHPDHAGRRLGAALIDAVAALARSRGHERLTLTTFRDVPWNGPYYARLGFREIPPALCGPGLRRVWERHRAMGLDMDRRIAMARPA